MSKARIVRLHAQTRTKKGNPFPTVFTIFLADDYSFVRKAIIAIFVNVVKVC